MSGRGDPDPVSDGTPVRLSAGDEELTAAVVDRLRRLVELESPSADEAALRAVAADFAAQVTALGAAVETVVVPGVGEHVIGRLGGARPEADPILVLGHLDTVHPTGSFDPVFRLRDGRAEGPGTTDMKGGWACVLEALRQLRANGLEPTRPVVLLATCDEETGSEHSRELIERLADGARAVLVPEPPMEDGAAKTARKGVGWYQVEVTGRASHAGLAPEDGVNAAVELAHQLLRIAELAAPDRGTTVTPAVLSGGTASNVVPASARVSVDVRFSRSDEAERVDAAMRALEPVLPGARLAVRGGVNRPPMERTPAIGELYRVARQLAESDGWTLGEGSTGGASDGSLTAGMGVPTLDGIGPIGGGAHSPDEHVRLADLPRRVRLYAGLFRSL